ncbi:MAG: hypothetical protein D6732_24130, partial [Methanobacteriota archaeon]
MKKTLFLLCIWVISSIYLPSHLAMTTQSLASSNPQTDLQVNSTDVIPFVNASSPTVERGNSISILIGIISKENTSAYVAGIPFSLSLYDVERNLTRSLLNDTTIDDVYNYTLETYFTPTPLASGTYIANVTFQFVDALIVANTTFQVILDPDARVIFQPSHSMVDFITVGDNLTIDLKIENVGASNAFNISVSLQSIDEP